MRGGEGEGKGDRGEVRGGEGEGKGDRGEVRGGEGEGENDRCEGRDGVARVSIDIKGRCIHLSFKEGESGEEA